MEPIRLAVRKLVEQVLRGGDIDNRYTDSAAMHDGARAHRLLQRGMGKEYQKEVSLKLLTWAEDIPILLFGRADGVIYGEGGTVTIDEIKTTTLSLAQFASQQEAHLGQAKCYAHMLLSTMKNPPDIITLQLTYYQLESKEIQREQFVFTAEEIRGFVSGLLQSYGVWLRFARDWKAARDESIKALRFPYEKYREGQRKLAVAAYSAIESGKRLYAQAPTGTGKTLAMIFPSIKAMGEGKVEKLFYLTAKTVTRSVAEEAVRLMAKKGLRLKSVTLCAKEKACLCEQMNCNPEHCMVAKGHFDRVNDALLALLTHHDVMEAETILEYAREYRVCPHEFALDASDWADMVIGDYNHVFDPRAYLRRFFADGGGEYVFLIDEAHNLFDRVREMYSAALNKSAFDELKKRLQEKNKETIRLKKAMQACSRYLLAVRKAMEERVRTDKALDEEFVQHIREFLQEAEAWLALKQHNAHPLHAELLQLFFQVNAFTGIADGYGGHYCSITEVYGSDVKRTLFCLDPSGIIAEKLTYAKAGLLFSATLTPLPYYRELLGGDTQDGMLEVASPFIGENLLLLAHAGISTKYADRPHSIMPIAQAIAFSVAARQGNYMVYFPSYEYMREVYAQFIDAYPFVNTMLQESSMDEPSRAAFLRRFDEHNEQTLVGFCVLGGIFSEGIDLVGERLIGAIIVGVGLPKISLRQDLIKQYFHEKNGAGFDYAYVYPGMNKVLQAAGRVIRSESDTGMVLLIDSRFATAKYQALFPAHWAHLRMVRETEELKRLLMPQG